MPFVYHGKIANIDRTEKREDAFIEEIVLKAIETTVSSVLYKYLKLLPTSPWDPSFDELDPRSFLVTNALSLGLSWFEVEHFLDEIAKKDQRKYNLEKESLLRIDPRRKYYMRDGVARIFLRYYE